MPRDKRRFNRISVELPVMVYLFDEKGKTRLGEALEARVKDFSPVGAALNVATIQLNGRHLFYTCQDNPEMIIELVFELSDSQEEAIAVPARPVWFDMDPDSDKREFVVGLEFLISAKSQEIKSLCQEACQDEMMLVSLWKKLF